MYEFMLHCHAKETAEVCTLCNDIVKTMLVASALHLDHAEQTRQPEAEASQGLFALLI